jgi:hypothetical protein
MKIAAKTPTRIRRIADSLRSEAALRSERARCGSGVYMQTLA